jgi:hypothetical protein
LEVDRTLKKAFALCVKFQFMVTAVWKPRDMFKLEDLLSPEADSSDWGLNEELVGRICQEFEILPALDL